MQNLSKTTILLDLDGPLLDGKNRHYQCYYEILKENEMTPMPIEQYWKMKRSCCSIYQQLAITNSESINKQYLDQWPELIESPNMLILDQVQPGAIRKLLEWKGEGIYIALVTMRNHKNALMEQLNYLSLLPYLDDVIVTQYSKGGKGKSAAVSAKYAKEILRDAMWIGDTEVDFVASQDIGCKVCLVSNGIRSYEFLSQFNPDYLASSISEVNFVN
jgi:phosphoglycolate phosphatase-like HAD superfamily hydrolase